MGILNHTPMLFTRQPIKQTFYYSSLSSDAVHWNTAHTCHKLWTEICEVRQNFKWDLIKFCETFTKIAFKLTKGILKPLVSFNRLLINTIKCNLCLLVHKICLKFYLEILWDMKILLGIGFYMGRILWDFVSQCEIWHVWLHLILVLWDFDAVKKEMYNGYY